MATILILVERSDGERRNIALDVTASLADTRATLGEKAFMGPEDGFLMHGAPVDRGDEAEVPLAALVGENGAAPLMIGVASAGLDDPDTSVDRYNRLTTSQKLALFNEIEIYRGITATATKGFHRTFKPCIASWNSQQLPASVKPTHVSAVRVVSTFSEVGHSLSKTSSDKSSVSLTAPFGSGEAAFSHAKTHTTSTKTVKQYLLGQYLVNKVELAQDLGSLSLVPDFEQAILTAISAERDIDAYVNLIETLNERGYYVAKTFTLGGALIGQETTQIEEYTESEKQQTEFSVGFKMAIDGFGGGADYSHSEGSETTTSTTSKYKNMSLTQTGGSASAKDYEAWATSLNPAINWDVIDHMDLYPTLALIKNMRVVNHCVSLMDEYHTYDTVRDRQTVIDIGGYTTRVQQLLFSGGPAFG
ncbi:hypothetical protein CKO38_08210 [Rhodospirillum rubrum]|uniref:hypothetical protein n=1 Tax=Rhodospirillum rubrum TaxID=1085 RepID=UPI001908AEAE|nr:hypothetical protein [Rhodospirillum rubrum]MBK1664541.1 hypothetical protein [Rhodospirillum rubrum]MBK1676653.1 hypothetical protein [Rhodospirillum rubrum]